MPSATSPPSLEGALEAALRRYDGPSPLTGQVHYHFGLDGERGEPGRRMRMRLLLAVAAAEGAECEPIDAACAVELLHHAGLVHDDIERGDDQRLGRGTLWSQFGLAHGINAGDALAATASLQVLDAARLGTARPPAQAVAMMYALQSAHYAACAGRAQAIQFERVPSVDATDYRTMLARKVGTGFAVAAELGALAAGAEPERAQAYARLGRSYRVAFEIEADVELHQHWSYPVVETLAGPGSPDRDAIAALYARARPLDEAERAEVRLRLERLGAIASAAGTARSMRDEADVAAEAAGIDRAGDVRALLRHDVTTRSERRGIVR